MKTELNRTIIETKKGKWEELRSDINKNQWGLGYKIVMRKLGAKQSTPHLNSETIELIVNTLFPTIDRRIDLPEYTQETSRPLFTLEEMSTAANTLKTKKATGPDGIPVEGLKLVATERLHLLLSMFMHVWKRVFSQKYGRDSI